MAVVNAINPVLASSVVTPASAAASDTVPVAINSRYLVRITNGGGSPITVTFSDPNSVGPASAQVFTPSVQWSVTNATTRVGILDSNRFRDTNGNLNIAFSATASVTYEVIGPL